jgi:hypothetical protein
MAADFPPPLSVLRRYAALHGCVVRYLTETQGDRIDILAELGGEATALQVVRHEGGKSASQVHARYQTLVQAGAVERVGQGQQGTPYRYRLTPVGELLRRHR